MSIHPTKCLFQLSGWLLFSSETLTYINLALLNYFWKCYICVSGVVLLGLYYYHMTSHHSHCFVILIDQRFEQVTLPTSMSISYLNAVLVNHYFSLLIWSPEQSTVSTLIPAHQWSIFRHRSQGFVPIVVDLILKSIHYSLQVLIWATYYHNYSMPWAKIITIPGSRIMSSLMWVLSQAITTTACFPGILRAVYCSYCLWRWTFEYKKCSSQKRKSVVYRDAQP